VVVKTKGTLPQYATKGAAGADLQASEECILRRGVVVAVPTGTRLEIPEGYEGQVRSRSGWARRGIITTNAPGTIDSDYRGEIKVLLMNLGDKEVTVNAGDRIAQIVICPVARVEFVHDELSETERGEGGFGHTGIR
jgi:dUTP pyrophosphatase